MEDVRKILAVSWMTKYCQSAIHYAVSLAEKYGAELTVIHVIDNLWVQDFNNPNVSQKDEQRRDTNRINKRLDKIIDGEANANVKVKKIVKVGDPVKEILKVVNEEKIDLLVMRAHQEGRIERFLVGNPNDAIIRNMPCSVLLVKAKLEPEKDANKD
jgi:universal stress protein A